MGRAANKGTVGLSVRYAGREGREGRNYGGDAGEKEGSVSHRSQVCERRVWTKNKGRNVHRQIFFHLHVSHPLDDT